MEILEGIFEEFEERISDLNSRSIYIAKSYLKKE
jgi:hypothetical protein